MSQRMYVIPPAQTRSRFWEVYDDVMIGGELACGPWSVHGTRAAAIKEVRRLGCVPTDLDTGEMIDAPELRIA